MPGVLKADREAYSLPAGLEDRLQSPALIVYLDHVRANVARVIDALDGDPLRWRPHVKTVKLQHVLWRRIEKHLK